MSELKDNIFAKQKEIEILQKMNELSKLIYSIQESVIDYEEYGFNINDLKPFITNYPLKLSLDEYAPHRGEWGCKDHEPKEQRIEND